MEHRHLLDELFGAEFVDKELIPRIVATTTNTEDQARNKMDNCLAYLLARGTLADLDAPLVCNLGPDEAWHVFLLYTFEYARFCNYYFGGFVHHDPAGESALVNSVTDTLATVSVMERNRIAYDPLLWRDYLKFPRGAEVLRTGVVAR